MAKVTDALKTSEQSLRELSARRLRLQDDERRQIARDMHDSAGQSLTLQAMLLSNLLRREAPLAQDVREVLAECAAINERIIQEVRGRSCTCCEQGTGCTLTHRMEAAPWDARLIQ